MTELQITVTFDLDNIALFQTVTKLSTKVNIATVSRLIGESLFVNHVLVNTFDNSCLVRLTENGNIQIFSDGLIIAGGFRSLSQCRRRVSSIIDLFLSLKTEGVTATRQRT
jgi:hypothetical protein